MILVVGATGLLGGSITRKLLAQGKPVRILVRRNSPSEVLAGQGMATLAQTLIDAGAEPVYGDLKDPASLEAACQGVETVLTTAASTLRDFDLEGVDLNGTKNLIDAAKRAGVSNLIYTSANGRALENPMPVLKIKAICESHLNNSGLTRTVLLPAIIMEIWIGMVVGTPLRAGQPVTLYGKGDHRHNFVAMEDVAKFGAATVDSPAAKDAEIQIGGPASYSWTEVVQTVGKVLGRELPIQYISPGEPAPLLPSGVDIMLAGMETFETFVDMSETSQVYGVDQLTSLENFARHFFAPVPTAAD